MPECHKCRRIVSLVLHEGDLVYEPHLVRAEDRCADPCEASLDPARASDLPPHAEAPVVRAAILPASRDYAAALAASERCPPALRAHATLWLDGAAATLGDLLDLAAAHGAAGTWRRR